MSVERTNLLAQLGSLPQMADMREHSRFNLNTFANAIQAGVPGSITISFNGRKGAPVDVNYTSMIQ